MEMKLLKIMLYEMTTISLKDFMKKYNLKDDIMKLNNEESIIIIYILEKAF